MQKPYIEPSDMYKAFQYVQRHLDEWIVKVDDDWNIRSSLSGGDEHLPMHRDQIDLFYSQEAQSLRLIDHEHDMVITAKYNVWSEEKEDFVDRVYFRKESEQRKVGDGILMHEGEIDGRMAVNDAEALYREHFTKEQAIIFANLSTEFRFMHSEEGSGITCIHEDRFRLGDRDSCYYGYAKRNSDGDIDI